MASSRLERIGTIFTRKQGNQQLLKNLSEVLNQLEADYNTLKDNEQKLEHLTGALIKCIQQATNAHKQKLKVLTDIHNSFKKECEDLDGNHRMETEKLADDLEEDIQKLQQKLVSDTKRSGVEGLITRGGIKPDDRPIWFDVYRAFPPIVEPKYSRPVAEKKPIRQILYKEDGIRAKFHAQGKGFGTVNMLTPIGDTHIKKLVKQYEKLESEGTPEDYLIEKSLEAVGVEHQQRIAEKSSIDTMSKEEPKSNKNIDIKNIFN